MNEIQYNMKATNILFACIFFFLQSQCRKKGWKYNFNLRLSSRYISPVAGVPEGNYTHTEKNSTVERSTQEKKTPRARWSKKAGAENSENLKSWSPKERDDAQKKGNARKQ